MRKPDRQWAAIFVLTFLLTEAGLAQPSERIEVPFEWQEHLIVLPVSIDGLDDLHFALDTGSTKTILSEKLGRRLGLKGETVSAYAWGGRIQIQEVTLPRLTVGQIKFDNVPARLSKMPSADGLRLDGLIGLDLLKRTSLTIDFESQSVIFGCDQDSDHWTSFYAHSPIVPITVSIEGRAYYFQLDTGIPGRYSIERLSLRTCPCEKPEGKRHSLMPEAQQTLSKLYCLSSALVIWGG